MTLIPNKQEIVIDYAESFVPEQHGDDFKKIAIIGCGYVGTALASYWERSKGYRVTATTTRQERVKELELVASQVVVMKGKDSQTIEALLHGRDTVILSIAPISNRQVDAEVYRETYIPTAQNLVAALLKNSSVKQVFYLSTCSVYGNKQGNWVDETSPVDTGSEYNQVLSETEQLLLNSGKENTKITILRLGGIYGPKRELTKRLAKFAGQTISGSSQTFTNWVHIDDIVAAIDFLYQTRLGGIYNLVNDFDLTIGELSDLVCARQGVERIIWDNTQPGYRGLNARVSNQKIKAAGYKLIHAKTIV